MMEVRHGARELARRAARLRLTQPALWLRRKMLCQLAPVDALEHQHGARDLRDEVVQLDHGGMARGCGELRCTEASCSASSGSNVACDSDPPY